MADLSNGNKGYQLEMVSKAYDGRIALSQTTFGFSQGERIAVVGPSGSGKTTLLHMLAGVVQPDTGNIAFDGQSLSELRPGRDLSRLVGVIHQQFDLVPHLNVIHNVLAGRLGQWSLMKSLYSLISPRDRDLAMSALARVGLLDRASERTSRLSGGEQQRVAIARLLVQDPRLIVADEPVAALDPARARDLLSMLASIAEESNKTLVASLHSVEFAREYFQRVIGLRNGFVQFDLPVDQMTDDLLNELYELRGLEIEGVVPG